MVLRQGPLRLIKPRQPPKQRVSMVQTYFSCSALGVSTDVSIHVTVEALAFFARF